MDKGCDILLLTIHSILPIHNISLKIYDGLPNKAKKHSSDRNNSYNWIQKSIGLQQFG